MIDFNNFYLIQTSIAVPQARRYDSSAPPSPSTIGQMTSVCSFCHALKFPAEVPSMCCAKGKVKLSPVPCPPEPLASLMLGDTPDSKAFLNNIRSYNCAFAMTSLGCKQVVQKGWSPVFTVEGAVCHRIGSLNPPENKAAEFVQIYFTGNDCEAQTRLGIIPGMSMYGFAELGYSSVRKLNVAYLAFEHSLSMCNGMRFRKISCSEFNHAIAPRTALYNKNGTRPIPASSCFKLQI
jgi:hypothetical protein